MSEIITLETSIIKMSRMPSSKNGNPKYRIETTDGIFSTATDAQIGYAATNFEPPYGKSRPVTLTLDRQRKYSYVINIVDREVSE